MHKIGSSGRLRCYCAALVLVIVPAASLHAEDVPPPGGQDHPHLAIDSTFDINSFGAGSQDLNLLVPLGGDLNENGFRARFTGSGSWYKFVASESPRVLAGGRSIEADFLAGYGWVFPRVSILLLGGGAVIASQDDPGVNLTRTGAKSVLSIYATPTDQTMAYSRLQYTSIADAFEMQVKGGIKVLNLGYLGPEAKYSSRVGNSEFRLGPHLSGITIGPLAISLSAGYLRDLQLGPGHYFSVSLYAAF